MNSRRVVNGDWSESYSDAASLSTKTQNLCHCDHLICEPHEYHAVWSRCEEKWLGAFLRPSWVTCLETVTLYNSNCTLSLLLVFGLHKEIGVNQWAYPASCLHAKLGWLHPALVFPWTVRALLWHCNSSSSYSKLKKKQTVFIMKIFFLLYFSFSSGGWPARRTRAVSSVRHEDICSASNQRSQHRRPSESKQKDFCLLSPSTMMRAEESETPVSSLTEVEIDINALQPAFVALFSKGHDLFSQQENRK